MADTFDVVIGANKTRYDSAKEAGSAYFDADVTQQPAVIHGMAGHGPGGSARFMAETRIHGQYEDGTTRFLKAVPYSDKQADQDFRAGYLDALEKSVNERLKSADWEAAKATTQIGAPKLDPRLYDDISQLSTMDFEKAASAWEEHAPKDTVGPTFVDREWKRQNDEARQLAALLDAPSRGPTYGVMTLNDKTVTSIRFERGEIDGQEAFDVSFHMGNKTVGKLKGIDADTLADAVGEKNAHTIADHGETKGSLKGESLMNEYGLTPEEAARRSAMKEARKAAELIQLEQLEPDAADEKNVVEQVKDEELELIGSDEIEAGLARAALLRQRDREQLAREQESLGIKAESKRIDVENLSEKAQEQDATNDLAERTGGNTDRDSQLYTEREKNRQIELMDQVHNQFRVAGAKFYFKDQPSKIAMKDKGERMVSASNDERVGKAMATMAEAKGWKTIKVSGHPEFRREVWLEASVRGIEARGYKPTEQDLKLLEERRERAMHNTVEHDTTGRNREHQRQAVDRKTVSAHDKSPVEAAKATTKGVAKDVAETAAKTAVRAFAGTVLEHGAANYNHDPKEKPNYFVRLATNDGEKTVWGVDLKRGVTEGKVKTGDDVRLEYKGQTLVTVEALKRDKAGNVIGKEEITTNRNEWSVQKSEKAQVAEAVASALIDSKVKDPAQREALKAAVGARMAEREAANKVPAIAVYDKTAPSHSQQPERSGPVVERNAERVR